MKHLELEKDVAEKGIRINKRVEYVIEAQASISGNSLVVWIMADERDNLFPTLRNKSANKTCFDCTTRNPDWASVQHGVIICIGKEKKY